jgi:hypothetical protein
MFLSETRSLLVVSNTHDRSTAGKSAEHQLGPIDGKLLGDGSLAEHEIAGAVDAVCSKELATTEVEAAEVAVPGGVTAEDDFVVTGVETGDLQLEIVLI